MAKRSLDERIAQLEEQAKALKARKVQTERANDTRRKVVVGSVILDAINGSRADAEAVRQWLVKELPQHLTRDHDKEIFAEIIERLSKVNHA